MSTRDLNSLDRVLTTMGHQEPDRVPMFLSTTIVGARQLGLDIRHYFSRADHVVEAQLRMQKKFRSDCYISFHYGALDAEAFGAEILFTDNGPPNTGEPFLRDPEEILGLSPPSITDNPPLLRILETITGLKERGDPTVPILGLAIAPFSLPVMQMGFPAYLDLMADRPDLFARLMAVNEEFCVAWANAQFDAGITALTYYDPLSSPTNVRPEDYRATGKEVARRVISRLKGPAAVHLASSRVLGVLDDLVEVGAAGVGTGDLESAAEVKEACRGRLTMLGNLNGIAMCRWTGQQVEQEVKALLAAAAPGGGFILSDGHGEIPWQVDDDVLLAVSEAVHTWGRYPLDWAAGHGQ